MGLSTALPLLYILAYPRLPETPRWLAMTNRLSAGASVLRRLNPACTEAEALAAIGSMAAGIPSSEATR